MTLDTEDTIPVYHTFTDATGIHGSIGWSFYTVKRKKTISCLIKEGIILLIKVTICSANKAVSFVVRPAEATYPRCPLLTRPPCLSSYTPLTHSRTGLQYFGKNLPKERFFLTTPTFLTSPYCLSNNFFQLKQFHYLQYSAKKKNASNRGRHSCWLATRMPFKIGIFNTNILSLQRCLTGV